MSEATRAAVRHSRGTPESVGALTPQWVALTNAVVPEPSGSVRLSIGDADGPVYLEGVRTSDQQRTDWPWGDQVFLQDDLRRRFIAFDSASLSHGLFKEIEPIDTEGSTMLAIVR